MTLRPFFLALLLVLGAAALAACDAGKPPVPAGLDGNCASGLLSCVSSQIQCCPADSPYLCRADRVCKSNGFDCAGSDEDEGPNATTCLQPQCSDSSQCGAATPFCVLGGCEQCIDSSQCGGSTPVCAGGTCVECAGDAQCSGATRVCGPGNRCVECAATSTMPCPVTRPFCDTTGTCVPCSDTYLCTDPTEHICSPSGACVQCLSNSDCPITASFCVVGVGACTP